MKTEYWKNGSRNPERIGEVIQKLGEVWSDYPDLRLGQLLIIASRGGNLFSMEDDMLLDGLNKFKTKKER